MLRSALIALVVGTSTASASPGAFTVGAALGYDDPTRNIYSGVEMALRPTNEQGWGVILGVTPAYGHNEGRFMGFGEVGVLKHVPADRAIVRIGFVARTSVVSLPYRVAVKFGETQTGEWGITPAGMLHIEFQYGTVNPFVFGVRAGMGTGVSNFRCDDPDDIADCAVWTETIVASAFATVRLKNGFFADMRFGQLSQIALGYSF